MSERLLPPRKRDWTRGTPQIGVFLRTAEGGTIEMVHDKATSEEVDFVVAVMTGLQKLSQTTIDAVRSDVRAITSTKR